MSQTGINLQFRVKKNERSNPMAEFQFSCPQINCPLCLQAIIIPPMAASVAAPGEQMLQIRMSTVQRAALIGLCILLAVGIVAVPVWFFAGTRKMTFKAYVDGTDVVKLRGHEVWIEHKEWQLPNRITVNGKKWVPQWDGNTSTQYSLGWGFSHPRAESIKLTKRVGRGTIAIAERPSPENQETLSIQMDDGAFGGADWYEFVVSW